MVQWLAVSTLSIYRIWWKKGYFPQPHSQAHWNYTVISENLQVKLWVFFSRRSLSPCCVSHFACTCVPMHKTDGGLSPDVFSWRWLVGTLLIYPIKFGWLMHQTDGGGPCTKTPHAFSCRKWPMLSSSSLTMPPQGHHNAIIPVTGSAPDQLAGPEPGFTLHLQKKSYTRQEENSGTQCWQAPWHYLLFHAFSIFCSYSQFRSLLSSRDKAKLTMGFRPNLMKSCLNRAWICPSTFALT